jgi:hypothetical protein
MSNKRTNKTKLTNAATRTSMCSAWGLDATNFTWDNRWGVPMEAAAVGNFAGDDTMRPPQAAIFQQARRWSRLVPFIQRIHRLRAGFILNGLLGLKETIRGKRGEQVEYEWHPGVVAASPADAVQLRQWKAQHAAEIQRIVLEVMSERQITRNAVAIWQSNGRIILRPAETCVYEDEFGQEKLTITTNLTTDKIEQLKVPEKVKVELRKNPRRLTLEKDGELFQFRVLKDEIMGQGFGWPDLATLFHFCALEESLVVGDRQLADACRTVYEQHLLGHEIKSGAHAGSPAHFANEARRKGTIKEVKSATGKKILATNFDHKILIGAGRPEAGQFDALRYKAVAEHFALWGAPYAQMWSGVVNPFLMSLARQDALPERLRLQPFLAELIRKGMRCPVDVVIQFSDACFWDSRLLLDMMKAGLAAGPISQGSFLRTAGLRQSEELAGKDFEAGLDPKIVKPAYDAAHGPEKPGAKNSRGKPPGKNDKT